MFRFIFVILVGFFSCLYGARSANAAELFLYPDPLEIPYGQAGILELRIDTKNETINAAEIVLNFSSGALVMYDVMTGGSILPLSPELPFIGLDTVKIVGGTPLGFYGTGTIARLVVKAKANTTAEATTISFDDRTQVFLNDGKATLANLSVRSADVVFQSENSILITSSTHPDQASWYVAENAVVHWDVVKDARYSYELSRDPNNIPDLVPDEPVGDIKFESLEDGIYYFTLCQLRQAGDDFNCDGQTGSEPDISHFRIMIDRTPPEPFDIFITKIKDVFEGDLWYAIFAPHDNLSGIARIEVAEMAYGTPHEDLLWVEAISPYVLRDQNKRGHLLVKVIDEAGNEREVSIAASSKPFPAYIILSAGIFGLFFLVLMIRRFNSHKVKNAL